MTEDKRHQLLWELEKVYRNARKDPDISLYKLKFLHFELQNLRKELLKVTSDRIEEIHNLLQDSSLT